MLPVWGKVEILKLMEAAVLGTGYKKGLGGRVVSQIHCWENNSEFIFGKNLPTWLAKPDQACSPTTSSSSLIWGTTHVSENLHNQLQRPQYPNVPLRASVAAAQEGCWSRGVAPSNLGYLNTSSQGPPTQALTRLAKSNMKCLRISMYLWFDFLELRTGQRSKAEFFTLKVGKPSGKST